jgi:polar amino acid transport system substrate-binding protein
VIEKTNPKSFLRIPRKFLAGLFFLIALCVVGLPSEVFSTAISSNTFDHQSVVEVNDDQYNRVESSKGSDITTLASSNITQASSNNVGPKISLPTNLEFYPPDIKRIIERGYIEVAMISVDSPPFFQVDSTSSPCKGNSDDFVSYDNKVFCGLDVSLSKGIADQLGVDVHFIRSANTFNGTVDLVFENKADIAISKISRTLSRTKKVSFSKPYLSMKQSLLLNRVQFAKQSSGKRPEIAIRELTGNVGVIQDSSYVGYTTQKFPKTIVNEQPSWPDVLKAARNGDLVAAYRDELEVKRAILQDPSDAINFQTVVLTDTNDSVAMVLPWKSSHLREYVDQYLSSNNIDYTADSLLKKFKELLDT